MICQILWHFRNKSFSLNLGTNGVAYSSVVQSCILFLLTVGFALHSMRMRPLDLFKIRRTEYSWLGKWSKQGVFSGLDSLIRNASYIIVVLKAMNQLNDQSLYWMANTFIWQWLLVPVLALTELLKQDISTNHPDQKYKAIVPAYVVMALLIVMFWLVTSPGWYYFISEVLNPNEDNPSTVARLVYQLMPGYAFFIISSLNGSVFYAKAKVHKMILNLSQIKKESITSVNAYLPR